MSDYSLVRYDEMCRAIDAAYEVDEVANIRDQAMAIELYMRQQRNTEAERRACEIRLRAERKVGKLLNQIERSQGRRSDKATSSHPAKKSFGEHLDSHGIRKDQAYRFQQLANVPEEDFERALADPEAKPSTNGIIKQGRERPQMDPRRRSRASFVAATTLRGDDMTTDYHIVLFDDQAESLEADARRRGVTVGYVIHEVMDAYVRGLDEFYGKPKREAA